MKKRLISLALCLLMILSVCLVGCTEEETVEDEGNSKATLVMLVITEDQVIYSDEELAALSAEEQKEVAERQAQYQAVSDALNKITKAKYGTALKILYYTEDQYYPALEAKMVNTEFKVAEAATATKAYKALVRSEKKAGNTDEVKVYEMFVEQYPDWAQFVANPAPEIKEVDPEEEVDDTEVYPEVDDDQVDILFLGNYEKYVEYIEKGWLSKLNDALKGTTAMKLNASVFPAFLNAVKYNKATYAIPNNTVIGQYTTLLVNKKMADKYSDISQITSLSSAMDLIETVAKYEKDLDPVWCDSYSGFTNTHFWSIDYTETTNEEGNTLREFNIDPTTFSVLGATYNPDYTSTTSAPQLYSFGDILKDVTFSNQLIALKTIEFEGYRGEAGSTKDFAVGVLRGSGEDVAKYAENYYTVTLEKPVASQTDLFGSMFAVSGYTSSLNKSMEIITYLNTNEEFRNLFQYGIKGTNYKLDSDDCAARTEDNLYNMDVYKTGSIFIAYPDADRGMTYQTLENAKLQDLDVVTNPTMGFEIVSEDLPDLKNLKTVLEASEVFYEKINACTTIEELKKTIEDCSKEIQAGIYKAAIGQKAMYSSTEGDSDFSAYALYTIWAKEMGYIVEG